MNLGTDIIPRHTLVDFCEAHRQTVEDVTEAFRLLHATKARMEGWVKYFHLWRRDLSDFDLPNSLKSSLDNIARCTWGEIISRTGARDAMTEKRRKELDEQLERGKLPPIEPDCILAFIDSVRGSLPEIIHESIREAADRLRHWNSGYKTNNGWELGDKAILKYGVEWSYGSFRLNYHRSGELASIQNAFSLLDGKGPAKYPSDLETAVRDAMQKGADHCETEYFRCKWFKAGTMHIWFKRPDLVRELNRAAADHRSLKPGANHA